MLRKLFATVAVVIMSSMTLTPANAAETTFYLNLKANTCYSYTKTGTKAVPVDTAVKNMYPVSCTKPHHFQVIKVGQVPTAGTSITQEDMSAYCSKAYRSIYKSEPLVEIKPGSRYLRWFFPDPGAETKKYKKQGICIVHKSDSKYSVYSVLKSKI
jgi:hypothetical protein